MRAARRPAAAARAAAVLATAAAPALVLAATALGASGTGVSGTGTGTGSSGTGTPAPAACAGRAPSHLRLTRLAGPSARLSWRVPSAGSSGGLYRVLRAGRTVGQTSSHSLKLKVTPGRLTTFTVRALGAGASAGCAATLRTRPAWRPPGRVLGLRVLAQSAGAITVGWRAATPGDAPVEGYRVMRDRAVVGQTRARRFALRLSSARGHRITVAAVDTRGRVGPVSGALLTGAHPQAAGGGPGTPTGLSASDVSEAGATVWWIASHAGGARIVGYRVYRDGQLVGQTSQTSMRLAHLSFPHTYAITVGAVDADKRESPRTAPLSLSTSHTPPSGPAQLAAVRVDDTSATLSWQAGAANGGHLVGYLLYKNGEPVGVVSGQTATVTLASAREYAFTVRALDSLGYLSAPSPEVKVLTTHTPPSTPGNLSAGEVTSGSAKLSWSASAPVSGEIVGYRVFRDEIPVGQTSATELTLQSLAPSTEYQLSVVAVDSLGAISAPATVTIHTAEPTPSHGHVQAFLLASTDQSFEDFEAHYQQLGVVYPTYFDCAAGGEVTGSNDPLITGWALARKVEVMPRINCQNVADEEQILNEPAAGAKLIENLAALCRTYGYSGVQIDFEGAPPAERNPFTAFIKALSERLHGQGNKLSTIVTAKYYNVPTGRAAMYDDAALSNYADYIFVLDWGIHWTTSAPGSIDEYPWFKRVAEYTATMPNRSKFTLGMPMYGIDWPNGGGSGNPGTPLVYGDIVSLAGEFGVTPEWEPNALSPHFSYTDGDGVHHDVWYTDKQSIGARAELATSLGLNVGLWRLGEEDPSVWELPQLAG